MTTLKTGSLTNEEKPQRSGRAEGDCTGERRTEIRARLTVSPVAASIAATAAALLVLAGGAMHYAEAQNNGKYALVSPGGIAFSDFRGYEDWAVVSSAHTSDVQKVIVANPKMIQAYKSGVPGNGKAFPEGSMIVKLQWSQKKSTEATFDVDVPAEFRQAFVMEKDSKKFPQTGGWGYAVFNYDTASNRFSPDAKSPANCGDTCHVAVKAKKDYIFHPYEKR
ncbi:MAG TPA: cytochrome P460 family protein [Acidobacteriaceae bacterium]|jgi:hypothetical protein